MNLWNIYTHLATSTLMLIDWTHQLFVLSIRGPPNELKLCHEKIVHPRQVIFCNRQKARVLCEFVKIYDTFCDVYTDVEWLNTSVVCSYHQTTYVAKCVENFRQSPQYPRFLSVTKNDLSSMNNLFMAEFQLNSMSSDDKRNY